MEELGEEGRAVYELIRTEFAADLDSRFKEQGEVLLRSMTRLLEANNATLDGLLSVRVDDVREEMAIELEQLKADANKGVIRPKRIYNFCLLHATFV